MNRFNSEELKGLLKQHRFWLDGSAKGKRADLRGANLEGADLEGANLGFANLKGAHLEGANLEGADLRRAYLGFANLKGADLRRANLKVAYLRRANLKDANLEGADLLFANLEYANLSDVVLENCVGNGREVQSIQTSKYLINITKDDIQIGCKRHSIEAWLSFSDNAIQDMDKGALDWWNIYKPILVSLLEA